VPESPAHGLRKFGTVTAQDIHVNLASDFQILEYRFVDLHRGNNDAGLAPFPEAAEAFAGCNAFRFIPHAMSRNCRSAALCHSACSKVHLPS
jgi:hypothetical protein